MKSDQNFADNNFTVLRLLLALMVVLGHFQLLAGVRYPPWPFNYAAMAVDCFFVASGYLVTSSFDRDSGLSRFYIRRFFRIYPLYIAVVTAQTFVLGALVSGGALANLHSLLRYFVVNAAFANFLQYDVGSHVLRGLVNPSLNPSLWTLKIEFAFYLILPALWWAVRRYGTSVLVAIFVLSALYYGVLNHAGEYRLAKQLPGQLQFFVLGMAVYKFRDRLAIPPWLGLVATLALAAFCTSLLASRPPVIYPFTVGSLVAVAALAAPRLRLTTDISYGVYLLHGPIIQLSLLFGLYQAGRLGLGATVAAVLVLAAIVERVIERPGIAAGRRLSRKFGPPAAPRVTPAASTATARALEPGFSSAAAAPGLTVVVLNDFCHVQGGASKVAVDESLSLTRSGTNVIFLGAVGPVCAELRRSAVAVECLGQSELLDFARHPGVALQALWNFKAARRARAILQALPRDNTIVHVHGYTTALSTSPVRMARRLGFPVVCTLHDFFAACPNGAFFDYLAEKPCLRRPLSRQCVAARCDKRRYAHKLFRVLRSWLQRHAGRFPDAIEDYIALSNQSGALLAPYLPRQARLHHLPNLADVVPQPSVAAAKSRAILYIGRLDIEKGVRLLAEVSHRLGIAIVFVGDGPLRPELEAIPGVSVTGWLGRDEVRRHLDQARCLVFPSLWYETYGLTVSEAAARGIPAIVSDISAAAERVRDGVTGWRFRSGDAGDLARCLRLIEDDAVVAAAGDAAYRAFWSDAETPDVHAKKLMGIYDITLRRRTAACAA